MHDARPSSAGDSEGSSQPGTATGPRDFGNGAEHVLTRKAEELLSLSGVPRGFYSPWLLLDVRSRAPSLLCSYRGLQR